MNAHEVHRDAVVVDGHLDLALTLRPELGVRGTLAGRWIPELREGGVNVQVVPLFCDPDPPEGALRRTLELLGAVRREARRNPDQVAICGHRGEIDAALDEGKIALVLALEGALALGADPGMIEIFFDLGVRMASFTHMGRSFFADGSAEEDSAGRLTRAGVAALREMEGLGMLFDCSHLSARGVGHVIEIATRPVVASHSSARALFDHHRNLEDGALRAIAATGGVIGVNLLACLTDPSHPSVERVVDHLAHLAEVVGVRHVAFGSDFVREIHDDLVPPHFDVTSEGLDSRLPVPGLYASRHLPHLTKALSARGFGEGEIRAILGENWMRVFGEVMGVSRPTGPAT